jgi:hypothetical protein
MNGILARFAGALHGERSRLIPSPEPYCPAGRLLPRGEKARRREPCRGLLRTALGKVLAAGVLALAVCGCGRPPQIGADDKTFKAVDALYTAVSLREVKLVDQCQATLKGLREAGSLGDDVSNALDSIIAEAKGGAWEDAQTRLASFMEGQRRGR